MIDTELNRSPFYDRGITLSSVLENERVVALDCETYYSRDYSASTNGLDAYINSPEFDMTCIAWFSEGCYPSIPIKWSGDPKQAPVDELDGAVIFAHNAEFDRMACERAIELGQLPPFKPKRWVCTMDMGKYFGYPGALDKCARHLLGRDLSKAKRGEAKGWTKEECLADPGFLAYCLHDAQTCYWIGKNLMHRYPAFEERISFLTREYARNGIGYDKDRSKHGQDALECELVKQQVRIPWEGPSLSLKEFHKWCEEQGMSPPATTNAKDARFLNWAKDNPDGSEVAFRMSLIRKLRKMISTLKNLDLRVREDGRVSTPLNYWGAHTGRFSGSQGVNFQGLAKKELMGVNVMGFFRPDPGKCFIQFDFANIEPRVLLVLAGDEKNLELIRKGMDIYEAHARVCGLYSGDDPLSKADPDLRQICKARVLGLGYGCGPKTFREVALAYNLELSEDESVKIVKDYRRQNNLITRYWNKMEGIAMSKIGDHKIPLPSGRFLRFEVLGHDPLEVEYIRGRGKEKTWGAKLVENVTQAVARDILADCLVTLKEEGMKVLLHVHDSVIIECERDRSSEVIDRIREVVTKPPQWMPDIPLQVDVMRCSNGLGEQD